LTRKVIYGLAQILTYTLSVLLNKEFKNFTLHKAPISIEDMECIRIDSFHRLWVGTNFGLYCWEDISEPARVLESKPQVFLPKDDNPNSINSGRVHQVYEDSNHIYGWQLSRWVK
jgi:hypothetical protein